MVLTYRDGEVPGDRPLRVALGDVASSALERIQLNPLSRAAVAELAGVGQCHQWTKTKGRS